MSGEVSDFQTRLSSHGNDVDAERFGARGQPAGQVGQRVPEALELRAGHRALRCRVVRARLDLDGDPEPATADQKSLTELETLLQKLTAALTSLVAYLKGDADVIARQAAFPQQFRSALGNAFSTQAVSRFVGWILPAVLRRCLAIW